MKVYTVYEKFYAPTRHPAGADHLRKNLCFATETSIVCKMWYVGLNVDQSLSTQLKKNNVNDKLSVFLLFLNVYPHAWTQEIWLAILGCNVLFKRYCLLSHVQLVPILVRG